MAIEEIIKRRVVQLWLSGEARDKIAADNNIGAGTVSTIVDDYKTGLDHLDLDSFRELMVEAKKRGMTPSDLASHARLYNYFRKSTRKTIICIFDNKVKTKYQDIGQETSDCR